MKTKLLLCCVVALSVFTSQAFSQTGKTAKPATNKGGKKGGTKKGGTTATTTNTTAPASTTDVAQPAKPVTDGGRGTTTPVSATTMPVSSTDDPFKDLVSQAKPVIVPTANGAVNYTDQYVEAKGSAVIDNDKFKNPAQARLMAERGAVVVAQRNLLEMVKGVSVIGETTVQDMITTGDYVYTRVEGVVKGAKQIGPARENNGAVEVTLRMPLYDNSNGVSAGFTDAGLANARRSAGLTEDFTGAVQTGVDIIQGDKPLAFNIAGQKIDPSMFPVVVDENGKVLLDFSKIYQKTGNVPKILELSKDLLNTAGLSKAADVIDLVQDKATGKFTLADPTKKGKVNWAKIGNIAGKVGKVLLNILL